MFSRLSLVVPGCCGALPAKSTSLAHFDPAIAKLSLWSYLARADRTPAVSGFHQQLATLFGHDSANAVSQPASSVAWAALHHLAESGEADDKIWLHADPVCMQADMDHAILFDAHSLQLRDDEADQLLAELNAHFAQDGITLQRYSASIWYLSIDTHTNFSTHALHEVIGRNVNQFMPMGEDAGVWKRFMNEAQMLLHMSEVNQQREARGHLPVNSIWLWGEGRLPRRDYKPSDQPFDNVISANPGARGLAKLRLMNSTALPDNFSDFIRQSDQGSHVMLVLDALFNSLSYADIAQWQQQLVELHQQWLQPLLVYCFQHKISLDLYPCNGIRYHLQARQRYRVWRRGHLHEHLVLHE